MTPEVFDVLGVRPMRGRAFGEPDSRKGAPLVVILADALWQSDFGGDANIVRRRVEVNGVRAEIVGVMPAGFAFPDAGTRLLVPLFLDPAGGFGAFRARSLARLAPGITLDVAQQEITALKRGSPSDSPTSSASSSIAPAGSPRSSPCESGSSAMRPRCCGACSPRSVSFC